MYNDGVITNEFTGYYDNVAQEYVYPDSKQNFVVVFPDFYLSADDGDFTTNGVTISSEVCSGEDITIGNAPAQVLSTTMLNPNGLMDSLTWGWGMAAIGVVTGTAAADTYNSYPCYATHASHHYALTASGQAVYDSTTTSIGGTPKAVIVSDDGTALYLTDTAAAYWSGSAFTTPSATAALTFTKAKYADREEPIAIVKDANGCPTVWNDVANDTKTTYTYVPMGIFDFSNVDAFGITFNAEAYDKMVLFDADATDWVKNLDYTSPKTMSTLITELMTEMGMTAVVSGTAVNTSMAWSTNPITSYSVTYRQVLKWIAEAIGCNVRVSRTGQLVFWVFGSSVATITPDTIISNTRTKNRYTIPQMTRVVCYNTVGAGYEDGVSGPPYYVIANPFIDPSAGMTPVTNLLSIVGNIPTYYPTTISVACADPRIDVGEYITVNATDGTSYVMPIMRQTLSWNGMCKATYIATGNQTRDIPTAMTGNDLSSVVNSNPAAVVNKIMAKGITVYDSSNNVLFSAIGDDHLVEIAGFDVTDKAITKTIETAADTSENIYVGTNKIETSITYDMGGYEASVTSTLAQGFLEIQEDDGDPSATRLYKTLVDEEGVSIRKENTTAGTLDLAYYFADEMSMFRAGESNETTITRSSISVTDGTATTTTSTNGITFDDGTTSPQFKIIQRVLTSAGSLTLSLDDGIYMCIVTRNNSSSNTQIGLYIMQVRANGNSGIRAIASSDNSSLSISGGTLTWTTTTTYKTLTILRITG